MYVEFFFSSRSTGFDISLTNFKSILTFIIPDIFVSKRVYCFVNRSIINRGTHLLSLRVRENKGSNRKVKRRCSLAYHRCVNGEIRLSLENQMCRSERTKHAVAFTHESYSIAL